MPTKSKPRRIAKAKLPPVTATRIYIHYKCGRTVSLLEEDTTGRILVPDVFWPRGAMMAAAQDGISVGAAFGFAGLCDGAPHLPLDWLEAWYPDHAPRWQRLRLNVARSVPNE